MAQELTLDQQKAIAMASARQRAAAASDSGGVGGTIKNFMTGVGQGFYDVPASIAELGGRGLDAVGLTDHAYDSVKQAVDEGNSKELAKEGANPDATSFKGGRVAGQILTTAPLGEIAPIVAPAMWGGRALAAAGNGALQGILGAGLTSASSDAPLSDQLEQGGTFGGILGGGLKAAGTVGAGILAPKIAPAARSMLDAGIPLTIGQTLGGATKHVEDAISGIPIVGSVVNGAKRNATAGFNKVVLNSALKPIGQALPSNLTAGREAVDYVANKIGERYDNLLPSMTGVADHGLQSDLQYIVTSAIGEGAKPDVLTRFGNVVKSQISDRLDSSGSMTGQALKDAQQNLGRLARKYTTSGDADDQQLGSMILDAHGAFNDMLARANPTLAPQLKDVNTAFAQYARIRKAASALGSKDGVFSAPQFSNAVKASDSSAGKGNYARGQAYMQDLSDPANQVLPSSVPDSGTATRLAIMSVLGGGSAIAPHLVGPGLLGGALYTRPGQALLRNAVSSRPAWALQLADQLRRVSATVAPHSGFLGSPGLLALSGPDNQ